MSLKGQQAILLKGKDGISRIKAVSNIQLCQIFLCHKALSKIYSKLGQEMKNLEIC